MRSDTQWFTVDNASVAGAARRRACLVAERLGFDEARVGDVGIVVSEIVANLWKHATNAEVGLQIALRDGVAGLRVIATDHGPGMTDVDVSAIDGHSTSGTLGLGLGAVLRLASDVDISSMPKRGTVLTAVIWPQSATNGGPTSGPEDGVDLAGVTRPISGEEVCGDAVGARVTDGHHVLVLSDGLGHGPVAAGASTEAIGAFHTVNSTDPKAILASIHTQLLGTRGAAVAVAAIDPTFRSLAFAGIGNVSAFVDDGTRRSAALSQPGIVGHQRPTIRLQNLALADTSIVILHSDGVRENWDLRATPGLTRRSAGVIAATLLRDAGTRPDDASVLVARRAPR